ncbi:MAG: hypothetical protein WDN06_14965 [Asticcacaulis sp.]
MTQAWLKGQGVDARLKFDTLSLKHLSGHIVVGDAASPEFSIDKFDADYSLSLFGGQFATIKTLHVVHPVMAVSLKGGQLNFGTLDKLVQGTLSAPPGNAPPPRLHRRRRCARPCGHRLRQVVATGGLAMTKGRLSDLSLKVPAAHLSGPLGEGDLSAASLKARTLHSAAFGDQLAVQASLSAAAWDLRGASPVEAATPDRHAYRGPGARYRRPPAVPQFQGLPRRLHRPPPRRPCLQGRRRAKRRHPA